MPLSKRWHEHLGNSGRLSGPPTEDRGSPERFNLLTGRRRAVHQLNESRRSSKMAPCAVRRRHPFVPRDFLAASIRSKSGRVPSSQGPTNWHMLVLGRRGREQS